MLTGRRGFTLAELVVAIVIAGVLAAAVMDVVIRQQRFFAADARAAAMRAAVRQAADILSNELRPLTPRDGDLYAAAADHVDFRMLLGASVLCTIAAGRDGAVLPPTRAASALGLTAWVAAPVRGDTLLVLDAGARDPGDERWTRHVLTADPATHAPCPPATGFTGSAAEGAAGWELHLWPLLAATVRPGAAVRFVRRARFELYRASDTRWYLGFADCLASRAVPCAVVQPVSGPYDAGGIRFTYLDSLGAAAAEADVARIVIDIVASAAGAAPGVARSRDSLRATVAVRN